MITKIAIENFKGIRDRLEFELKPITLLFGANSVGKSTVLHALHYAREIFERHNVNPDRTISGGNYVDLGGFDGFVHGKDRSREVSVGVSIDLSEVKLPDFDIDYATASELHGGEMGSLIRNAKVCSVEVTVGWSTFEKCPYVSRTKVFYDDKLYAEITAEQNLGGAVISRLATDHPSLTRLGDLRATEEGQATLFEQEPLLSQLLDVYGRYLSTGDEFGIEVAGRGDGFPDLDGTLELVTEPLEIPFLPKGASEADAKAFAQQKQEQERTETILRVVSQAIAESILGPMQLIRQKLQHFRYLGPLRDTPPRNYEPPRFVDPSRWASGLGAWDKLQSAPEQFVSEVASWLGDEDRLNSGYRVERRQYREFDLADPFLRKLMSGRAFDEAEESDSVDFSASTPYTRLVIVPETSAIELRPHDVGIGISQVVPVVVTALDGEQRLLAIEQPELHLHPRLAAALADLFIATACGPQRQQFILETHSELIPLRIMRRIRETESDSTKTANALQTQDVVVYYIRARDGHTDRVRLDIDVSGDFIQPWPDDFFEIDFYERFR